MRNLKQMAAILKLSGLVLTDDLMKHLDVKDCLCNQLAPTKAEIVNESNGCECGAYLYLYSPSGGLV